MLNKKVRIGIIGGRFGSTFQFHEHPNCIVEAVCDLSPDQRKVLMDTYKCSKSYESFEELLKDKNIDAVAIFTPAPLHARHSIIALKAGKHVMCAVPAVMTIEEAEELKDTVEKTGLTYMMAETSYYHQSVISARMWYEEGKFGEIFYSEAEYYHPGLESL
ncbi:MAG: Gfo/Idh/MocA family oxidoreductase, partial [Armatimonadota bacterium]|nr:Gfo/Idh/MocA family oxidoreductase [Armatimonadota bacterium]